MRPFRGLTKEGKWVYGWYKYHPYYEIHIIQVFNKLENIDGGGVWLDYEVIPKTVGQFTGLKDKNGKKEVYVGDDIYFSMSQTQHYKGYVKWSEKGLCYVVECYWQKQDEIPHLCDGFEMKFQYKSTCVRRLDSECFDIEIIGNTHKEQEDEHN